MQNPLPKSLLLLLCLCGYLPAESKKLSLQEAINSAGGHNLGMRIAAVASANAWDSVQIEAAAVGT